MKGNPPKPYFDTFMFTENENCSYYGEGINYRGYNCFKAFYNPDKVNYLFGRIAGGHFYYGD